MGILTAATFRSNKIAGCPSMADKDLKSSGGGSFDYRINLNQSLRLLERFDNKDVILASTFSTVYAPGTTQRLNTKKLQYFMFTRP